MFASFCSKFIKKTEYQISSASPNFYRRCYGHSIVAVTSAVKVTLV